MANKLQWWAAERAPWLLLAIVILTIIAFFQVFDVRNGHLRLEVDPSLEGISTQSDAEREYANLLQRRFGSNEPIMVVVRADDTFTLAGLQRIDRLSKALATIDGVQGVRSLTATTIPRVTDGVLNYTRVTPESLTDPQLPEQLRAAAANTALLTGQLVSADGRAAAIVLETAAMTEREMLESDLAGEVLRVADTEAADGVEIMVTGASIIRSEISETVARQLRRVVPTIIAVVTVLLALAFRTVRGVVLPMITIVIAQLWLLAVMSVIDRPLNLITALVPPFLVTMGLAYCAHVLAEYESLIRDEDIGDPVERIAKLVSEISVPVAVTGIATIAGLLALMLNDQRSMVEFAWLAALGTAFLMVLTLTFVPAALRYCRPPATSRPLPAAWAFETGGEKLSHFDQRRRKGILAIAAAVFLGALLLASRIEIGDVFVGVFAPEARVRADYEAANQAIGGVNPLDIALEGGAADVFTDPDILRALDSLQTWLVAQPEVGSVTGLVDHVKLLDRYLGEDSEGQIPVSRDAIRQMLFVGESELLRSVVNLDRSSTLIRLRLTVDDTNSIGELLDRVRLRLTALPPGLDVRLLGSAVVMTESVETATEGQLQSIALALGLIFVCLAFQFMSPKLGLLASLPTMLQTAIYFGALGLLAVPLNPTTVLVECLVLGLAIDDTIHYLARFASAARRFGSEAQAASFALRTVLRPITLTKAILALGFLTMVTGELRSQAQFGWLAALTLACAWLVDVFVTPAFISGLRIVTLWDALRLNLGDNVQAQIPLFAGLSNRQARIFALMANLHTLPAGTRLISEGDDAGSIYVVIDGELTVYSGSGDQRKELRRMTRGDVVGERGYFGQKRSANVDTVTETRLLRFDDADQERICKAYPAIAARVFLSLNRLQAERQSELQPPARGRSMEEVLANAGPASFDSTLGD
ncbi:MAG: MMPL family transporter [Gammaproteobacteria bacterium]|nr:MMPL family transporter [Gammaproteobacteria bacterium]